MIGVLDATRSGWLLTPADSARAVEHVYTVSLLVIVPLLLAIFGAAALRDASAATRALVWRSAAVSLLIVYLGRDLPVPAMVWLVPGGLATPLVLVGRLQLAVAEYVAPASSLLGAGDLTLVRALILLYWGGVVAVLLPTVRAWTMLRRRTARAALVTDERWLRSLKGARSALGIRRRVRLLVTREAVVPATWGTIHPVVLLPAAAMTWSAADRRAVLLHELGHIRAGDWAFALVARVACALYWFHPGAWWVARELRAESEVACDDRVLAAGVRASVYANFLMRVAERLRVTGDGAPLAPAMARRVGLRRRLNALLEPTRDIRPARLGAIAVAAAATFVVALPVSGVRLAPTRAVLTGLMSAARWESRAYAVVGLAQRPDSMQMAQDAAALDPSPEVRALARLALASLGER